MITYSATLSAEQLQNNLGIYVSIFLLFFFIDRLLVHQGLVRHTPGLTETQMKSIADRHAGFLPVPFLAWEKLLCISVLILFSFLWQQPELRMH
jgi:hypothetical protein